MSRSVPGEIHPIDLLVGRNLTELRKHKGISLTRLSEHLGMSFQQVQKYEKGTNRISASVLYELAKLFGVTTDAFFSGADRDIDDVRAETGNTIGKITDGDGIKSNRVRHAVNALIAAIIRAEGKDRTVDERVPHSETME